MVRSRSDFSGHGRRICERRGWILRRGRRICDLDLSGLDDLAISLTDWEAYKALTDWEEHKGPDGKSASRRSTRFKEEKEYLEVTLDVRGDGDAVAIQNVVEMSEAALLPPTPGPGGLSSSLKAELRRIASMTKQPPVVAQQRPRLDRSMTGVRQALRGLQFLNQSVVTKGSWPEAEKRFDRLAVDGLLLRSRFAQCIGVFC